MNLASIGREARGPGHSDAATLRGSLIMLIGRFVSAGVGLGTQTLITWGLGGGEAGRAQYGVLTAGLAVAALVQSVLALGLDRTDTRFLTFYDEAADAGRILGLILTETITVVVMGSLALLAVWVSQGWIVGLSGARAAVPMDVVMILLLMAPLMAWDGVAVNFFAVFARPTAVFVRRYVLDPGLKLLIVVALIAIGMNVESLARGYLLAAVLGTTVYAVALVGLIRSVVRRLRTLEAGATSEVRPIWPGRPIFVFALPLLVSAVMYAATLRIPVLVLAATAGRAAAGVLGQAQIWAVVLALVPQVFNTLFLPRAARLVARGDGAGLRDHYWSTALWLGLLTFPLACMIIAFPAALVRDLLPPGYESAVVPMTVMGVAFYLSACFGLNGVQLQVSGRIAGLTLANLAGLLVAVGGSLALAPRWGANGAAVAVAGALIVPQVIKQGMLHGIGVGLVHRRVVPLWAGAVLLLAGGRLIDHFVHLPLWAALLVSVMFSGALALVMRPSLALAQVLPASGPILARIGIGERVGGRS